MRVMLNPDLADIDQASAAGKIFRHGQRVAISRKLWEAQLEGWRTPSHGRWIRTLLLIEMPDKG